MDIQLDGTGGRTGSGTVAGTGGRTGGGGGRHWWTYRYCGPQWWTARDKMRVAPGRQLPRQSVELRHRCSLVVQPRAAYSLRYHRRPRQYCGIICGIIGGDLGRHILCGLRDMRRAGGIPSRTASRTLAPWGRHGGELLPRQTVANGQLSQVAEAV